MTPLEAYQDQIDKGHLFYHPEQYNTLNLLEGTHVALVKRYQRAQRPILKALPSLKSPLPKGFTYLDRWALVSPSSAIYFFNIPQSPKKGFIFMSL